MILVLLYLGFNIVSERWVILENIQRENLEFFTQSGIVRWDYLKAYDIASLCSLLFYHCFYQTHDISIYLSLRDEILIIKLLNK